MRVFGSKTQTAFESGALNVALLMHIQGKDRETKALEALNIWEAYTDKSFTIDGKSIRFYGIGPALQIDSLTLTTGLDKRITTLSLPGADDTLRALTHRYDLRGQPLKIYRALLAPGTSDGLIDDPHIIFDGTIDKLSITIGAENEGGEVRIDVVSGARGLFQSLALRHSDAHTQRVHGDRICRYASVAGEVPVWWGEKSV